MLQDWDSCMQQADSDRSRLWSPYQHFHEKFILSYLSLAVQQSLESVLFFLLLIYLALFFRRRSTSSSCNVKRHHSASSKRFDTGKSNECLRADAYWITTYWQFPDRIFRAGFWTMGCIAHLWNRSIAVRIPDDLQAYEASCRTL